MNENIDVEIDNQLWNNFVSITITKSIKDLCGTFAIETGSRFPFRGGSTCRIYINGESILNGFIEKVDGEKNADPVLHNITFSGRDRLCDVVDSTIGGNIIFNGKNTLKDITEKTLSKMNITGIKVLSDVSIPSFNVGDVVSPDIGENVFDFLNRYAQKRQVLLTNDGNGNILYTRTSTKRLNTHLIYGGNIKSVKYSYDDSQRYNKYICYAQENQGSNYDDSYPIVNIEKSVNIVGEASDPEIRASRTYSFHPSASMRDLTDKEQKDNRKEDEKLTKDNIFVKDKPDQYQDSKKRCIWEANVRRANAFKYTCIIQGFIAQEDGIIWKPNLLVRVYDDKMDTIGGIESRVDSDLLISSVTYNYSLDTGTETTLELITSDAFNLIALEGAKLKKKYSEKFEGRKFSGAT